MLQHLLYSIQLEIYFLLHKYFLDIYKRSEEFFLRKSEKVNF